MNNYLGGYIFGEHSLIERDLEERLNNPYSDSSNFADCTRY